MMKSEIFMALTHNFNENNYMPLIQSEANRKKLRTNLAFVPPDKKRELITVLKYYSPEIINGDWLIHDEPNDDTLDALLCMLPPQHYFLPPEVMQDMFNSNKHNVVPPYTPNENFSPTSKSQMFLDNIWYRILSFRNSNYNPLHLKIPTADRQFNDFDNSVKRETIELRNRFGYNFQQAISALVNGYGMRLKDKADLRRTGENTWIHPLRTLFTSAARWIPRPEEEKWWVIYTSYLSMLLHDCFEDQKFFPYFRIMKIKDGNGGINNYEMTFRKNTNGIKTPKDLAESKLLRFNLMLTKQEYEVLRIQLDGLTTPKEARAIHESQPEKSAEIQFTHLQQKADELIKKFPGDLGLYAAVYLLRDKIEDRLDNLKTYFTLGENNKPDLQKLKQKKIKKIWETLIYFEKIEKKVENLILQILEKNHFSGNPEHYLGFIESAVNYCYCLLLGGSSNEIYEQSINDFNRDWESAKKSSNFDLSVFEWSHKIFIANPYTYFSDCALF